jgi:hypothetical protein
MAELYNDTINAKASSTDIEVTPNALFGLFTTAPCIVQDVVTIGENKVLADIGKRTTKQSGPMVSGTGLIRITARDADVVAVVTQ